MTGVSFTLEDGPVDEMLGRIAATASGTPAVRHAIGAHFVFSTQRNIELEKGPGGVPWQRLSPRTAEHRVGRSRKRGFLHMLRVKPSAGLYATISYQALADGVEWGSHLRYARIHQLGGTIDQPGRETQVSLKNIRKKGNRFTVFGAKGSTTRVAKIAGHKVVIPARPYLGVSIYDSEEVSRIVVDHLQDAAK